MEEQIYHDMIEMQEQHWWFRARREILFKILKEYIKNRNCSILEIGCGAGGNLPVLKNFGQVFAMEMDTFSIQYASRKYNLPVKLGWLPEKIPFDKKFDFICMLDVLEHIEDDVSALESVIKMLAPGGMVFLTVPAHKWLFGSHDIMHNHFRRYSLAELRCKLNGCKIKTVRIFHFNFFLFPLLILSRILDNTLACKTPIGYSVPNSILNTIFYSIFRLEKCLVNKLNLPFGGSLFAIIKNKN